MKLWPRLPLPRARARALQIMTRSLEDLRSASEVISEVGVFAPTGGVKVTPAELRAFRRKLEAVAIEVGYPNRRSRSSASAFDDGVLQLLADVPMAVGEALRSEMWAWVTVELTPHLVKWRWQDPDGTVNIERFAGTLVRNCFGRLWYQANRLDRGAAEEARWSYSDAFTSDQSVALLERPSLAGERAICLSIGQYWSSLPRHLRDQKVFREAMKLLTIRAGIINLDVLEPADLDNVVAACFDPLLHAD